MTDCLVLKLEEIDEEGLLDSSVYIIYDNKNSKYLIRGNRTKRSGTTYCAYSYDCDRIDINILVDFIQFVFCPHSKVNKILYTLNNLPADSAEITTNFLDETVGTNCEITGYNHQTLKRADLIAHMRMLKNVYNNYV